MNPLKTLTVSAVVLVASEAQAVPLLDHYLGGRHHGYGDVIGSPQLFDISRAEITRDQGRLKIDIFTNFVGHVRVYPTLTVNGKGIGYGDLFIGGAWTPFVKPGDSTAANTDGHIFDNAHNGMQWSYGLSFDDPWSTASSGTFSLFKLNGSNPDNLVLTEELFIPSRAIVRDGQPAQVDRTSATVALLGAGTWQIDASTPDKRLSFDLDLAQDTYRQIATWNYLSMHWGMTCNNDAIQGGVNLPPPAAAVPEPGTVSLLGLAAIGLMRRSRRKG
jgi:hypothetical protein